MTFSRIMKRAGITLGIVHARRTGGQGRTVRTLTFHSLRHSFNSALANAGIVQEVRQKLAGHATPEMNKRYTHHASAAACGDCATAVDIVKKAAETEQYEGLSCSC